MGPTLSVSLLRGFVATSGYGVAQSVSLVANLLVYSKGPGFKLRLGTQGDPWLSNRNGG
jgi:hypothetical protein